MAEHPSVRTVCAPYDSGHRGLRMGAGPDHLMDNELPEMLRSLGKMSAEPVSDHLQPTVNFIPTLGIS